MKQVYLLCLLTSFFTFQQLQAQDFPFGKVISDDLTLTKVPFDTTANAVVLREFGTAGIQINDDTGRSYLDYQYHVKIKIFNKQGEKEANIEIPLWTYGDGNSFDELISLTAITSNYEGGQVVRTDLDQKKVFTDQRSKYLTLKKFTMPAIKEGSIIEYTYRIRRPYIFNFVTWEFQSGIPKLHSEFIGLIPPIYNFNVSLRGFYKLTDQKAVKSMNCLRINGRDMDCSKMTYIMKEVPAFIEEDYMTAASNFRSAMYFELSDVQSMYGGATKITKTWKNVDDELTGDRSFGGQMKKKDLFKPLLPVILKDAQDELSKAKAIYQYINKQIKWNKYVGKYSENDIKKALSQNNGNIGDINLALIAALSAADLDVEAVILSTRENGAVNDLYPVITDFNYVIAKVNIGEKSYLLDASQPFLPFGLLPLHCINERGRVISLKKPSYWYKLKAEQKDYNFYTLDGKLSTDGQITGILRITSLGYSALDKRRSIAEAGSIEEYVEKLDEKMATVKILSQKVSFADSLDKELIEEYQVEMSLGAAMDVDQYYFSPFIFERNNKNPFNLNERLYPVDLGAMTEKRVVMNLEIPANFELVDKPKDISIVLPNNDAKYVNRTSYSPGLISTAQTLLLNKPTFHAEEYLSLKEFYSRVIQQQQTDLILKRVKK